ncbi:sulfotransferase family 2 domain-containing protein [Defluviicoccus vanus]|uniref:sulfotransferase family 2 domain-containing protein n=1 Tax=Defluviicoccus vanus TaxID=111831 RepID=UPI001CBA6ACF|nr:sulfotransferase family 2 domain-containing protein [Defluviicoccus vanus]
MDSAAEAPAKVKNIPKTAKVFYLHIEKTAGNSVGEYLLSLFPEEEICPAAYAGIWDYEPTKVEQYRLFHGHFYHDFIDAFPGPKIKLTMLREPCSRIVSLYDFWRSFTWEHIRTNLPPINGPALAKSCSFAEFLRIPDVLPRWGVSNVSCRQILGREYQQLEGEPDTALAQCIRRLETFDWVGITEDYQRSMFLLAHVLGAPEPPVETRLNRTYHADADGTEAVAKTVPSAEDLALLQTLNTLDTALHDHARQMLERRYAAVVTDRVTPTPPPRRSKWNWRRFWAG